MSQSAVPSSPLSGDDTDRQLASGLRLLRLVSPLTLIPYLPPILTHVLALLAWPSQQRDAFNSLIDLLHSVYLDATGSALTLATSYAEYVAMPSPQLCEDIVRLWSDAIRSLDNYLAQAPQSRSATGKCLGGTIGVCKRNHV